MTVVRQPLDGSPIVYELSGSHTIQVLSGNGDQWDLVPKGNFSTNQSVDAPAGGYEIPDMVYHHGPNDGDNNFNLAAALANNSYLETEVWFRESGDFEMAVLGFRTVGGTQQVWASINSVTMAGNVSYPLPDNTWQIDQSFAAGATNIPAPGVYKARIAVKLDGFVAAKVLIYKAGEVASIHTGINLPLSEIVDAPTLGGAGQYESIPADDTDAELPLAVTLDPAAVPGLIAGQQAMLLGGAPLALNNTGVLTNSAPNARPYAIKVWDPDIGATGEFKTLTGIAPGTGIALDALTVDAPIYAGRTYTFTTAATDLTGLFAEDLMIDINGASFAVQSIDTANPGAGTATLPVDKAGLLFESGATVTLLRSNGSELASGTVDLVARPGGLLITPPTAADVAMYPEAEYISEEGGTLFAEQLEDHGDGTYSVLVDGAWSTYTVAADLIPADISYNLNAVTGAYVWPAPAQEVSGGPWTGDATCLKAPTGDFSSVSLGGEAISNTAWVAVMHSTPDDNDEYGPGWSTSQTSDENMVYLGLSSNFSGAPDRIEIRRRVAGVRETIDICVLAAPVATTDVVKLRKSPTLNTFEILVNDVVVKTFEEEILGDKPYPFLVAEPLNTGSGCIQAVGVNGIDNLQIDTINNQAIGVLSGSDTLEFSQDHAITSATVTDEQGVAIAATVTTLGARQARFEADYSTLWQGTVTVTTDTGLSRQYNWQQPGQKFTNLLNATGILATAVIPANAQVSIPASTPGNWLPNGHFEANAGTSLPLEVLVQVNDGSGYSAAVSQWFFDKDVIDLVSVPVLSGAALDVDLVDFVPALAIPQTEVGSSGAGWSIDGSALPAGLTITGSRITGTAPAVGSYATSVTITFPDGAPVTEPFTLEVSDGITAADTQTHADSASADAVSLIVSVSPIDAHAHTDDAAVTAVTTLLPVVNSADTQIHTDSASAYGLEPAQDDRQVFNLQGVLG